MLFQRVAPYTGAWIEIKDLAGRALDELPQSHPTRVRGLKSTVTFPFSSLDGVAPYTGAWIEIITERYKSIKG